MEKVFVELTVVICLAAVLAFFFRFLKQPAILAYILAGVIVGPLGLFHLENEVVMHSMAQIGITLLLFMLGLELKFSDLRSVGKVAIIAGLGQIVFTSIIGYLICILLGFSSITSLYIAIALTFSSTIIIVKLLSDKKDLGSLYGRISVGFLLVQDFVAIIALIILSGFSAVGAMNSFSAIDLGILVLKTIVLFGWVIVISNYVFPRVISYVARSGEILFLFSLAWAFGVAALVSSPFIGFSIEIGGFLAGLSLANTRQNIQIVSRVRSLRDFFITIFFVTLGMKLIFANVLTVWFPSVLLSLFVLIGNPLIVLIILGLMGYRKRTSFLAGLTVAQISEFSMIVVFMGNKIGHVSDEVVSLVTMVGAITFVLSSYMILNGNRLYEILSPLLSFFEKKDSREKRIDVGEVKNHVILAGARRTGKSVITALKKRYDAVVVVDFDPDVVERLADEGIKSLYGDITDHEIQEKAGFHTAKLVISTIPDQDDNMTLIQNLRHVNKKAKIVVLAMELEDARSLYDAGADYVVLPHLAGSRHLSKILVEKNHLELIEDYKANDLKSWI